jgi:membrane protein implicated in regulation of membrane protease activity
MSSYWIWWIAAAALIAAELLSGTFYLLVVGLALACGGVAAWLGSGEATQWLIAGVLGVIGTLLLQRLKRGGAAHAPMQASLDVGQMVQVQAWGPDGTARVAYRGSTWDAQLVTPETTQAHTLYIIDTRGSLLLLSDRRPG